MKSGIRLPEIQIQALIYNRAMRNIYSILLVVAALLAGCSKPVVLPDNDVDIIPGSYIFFDAEVLGTKAAVNQYEGTTLPAGTNSVYTAIGVFGSRANGTSIFDEYSQGENSKVDDLAVVYRDGRNGPFVYDNLALWHGGEQKFFAYYSKDLGYSKDRSGNHEFSGSWDLVDEVGTHTINNVVTPYLRYVHPLSMTEMKDVMTASASASSAGGAVKLGFVHRLFALDIVLMNDSNEPMVLKSASVEFPVYKKYFMYYQGDGISPDVVPDTNSGQAVAGHVFFNEQKTLVAHESVNLNSDYAQTADGFSYYTFLLVPTDTFDIQLKLTYVNKWGEDYPWESANVTIDGGVDFEAGRHYTLKVNRKANAGTEVEFSAYIAVKDENGNEGYWTEKDVDHTFN